eukprot:352480-Chlamydomonas_euryale.AAC.8
MMTCALSTSKAHAGPPVERRKPGLDNGWPCSVRISLPMKEALCLARVNAMGAVGGWCSCRSAGEIM